MDRAVHSKEDVRWHASWIIASLTAILVVFISAWKSLEMAPLIVLVSVAMVLVFCLLWIPKPRRSHFIGRIVASIVFAACTGTAIWRTVEYDRPILRPEIGGVITQNSTDNQFGLDVEVLIRNAGSQSGYADKWALTLTLDGTDLNGREVFGQQLPSRAANEAQYSIRISRPASQFEGGFILLFREHRMTPFNLTSCAIRRSWVRYA